MNEQYNITFIRQVYADFKSGNISTLLSKMDANISWEIPEITNVPFAGKRQGRETVADFFTQLAAAQEVLRFEPNDFIAQGNRVVALGNYKWRVRETGRTYQSNFAHVFTIQNASVVAFLEYNDTAAVERGYEKAKSA